jgi:hypothetical protein
VGFKEAWRAAGLRHPRSRRTLSLLLLVGVNVGAALLALVLFDRYYQPGPLSLPGDDLTLGARTPFTLELFPYEGWHLQAWSRDGDFRLGQMGFAVDFDLLSPPAKRPDEYRIVLIGGSGAQGWGASSNEKSMARILERLLNERNDGRTYRVINMAMGSTLTYQNFIALNRWGHPLQPDLILSYSGINDYVVPLIHENMRDAHYYFNELNALALAARASEVPPRLGWLVKLLPNLMTRSTLGYATKYALSPGYFLDRARESLDQATGRRIADPNLFMSLVVTPEYIHALQSIRRDFDAIPMLVVLQAAHADEVATHLSSVPALKFAFYDQMYQRMATELQGPGWYLANFHSYNRRNPNPSVSVHSGDEGQELLARYVLGKLDCVFREAPPGCLADQPAP